MILYIDESFYTNYFIVGGLLAKNDYIVKETSKQFRKHAKSFPMKEKERRKVFTEFKSIWIDDSYPMLKRYMLKHISNIDGKILYASYFLNGKIIDQSEKEDLYIKLLTSIVKSINEDIAIYFDSFGKRDFDEKIINKISVLGNVIICENKDSLNSKGIQFADNICSVIRKHLSDNDNNYYDLISNKTKCVESV